VYLPKQFITFFSRFSAKSGGRAALQGPRKNLIDRFVDALNSGAFEPLGETEVPEELRTISMSAVGGWYEWNIFGTPSTGDYDPICFATRRMNNGDAPIVQIDHEDILSHNRKGRVVQEITPSFRSFVECVIAGEFKAGPSPASRHVVPCHADSGSFSQGLS
jgi:hypothetical protein